MSDNENPLISESNLQTVVAVCFVLALLSVAFNFYNFTRINAVFNGLADVQNITVSGVNNANQAQADRVTLLEKRIKKLEKQAKRGNTAAATPPPAGKAKGKGKKSP